MVISMKDTKFLTDQRPKQSFRQGHFEIDGFPEDMLPSPIEGDPDTISLAFLISLSVTFAVIMILLVLIAAYITFCGSDEDEMDDLESNRGGTTDNNGRNSIFLFKKKKSDVLIDPTFFDMDKQDEDPEFKLLEAENMKKMSKFEVELYQRAKEFQKLNPPMITKFGTYIDERDVSYLKDRGIQSYFFLPSINDNVDELGNFLPSFIIQDKLDISFTKENKCSSTVLNYPLPFNKRDAVYFEVKIFKFDKDSSSIFSIGLSSVPYPYFRIPGMNKFSIAYESTGKLRINNPFQASTLLPKLEEGDVVGFGYRYKTGTIFITHNGKKLLDVTQNVNIDLFICIGSMNASYTRTYTLDGLIEDSDNISLRNILSQGQEIVVPNKLKQAFDVNDDRISSDPIELNVNLGQIGFVFIEANVKKYAFGKIFGDIGIPPAYNGKEIKKDIILQKGEELPPNYIGSVIVSGSGGNNHNSIRNFTSINNNNHDISLNLDTDNTVTINSNDALIHGEMWYDENHTLLNDNSNPITNYEPESSGLENFNNLNINISNLGSNNLVPLFTNNTSNTTTTNKNKRKKNKKRKNKKRK